MPRFTVTLNKTELYYRDSCKEEAFLFHSILGLQMLDLIRSFYSGRILAPKTCFNRTLEAT